MKLKPRLLALFALVLVLLPASVSQAQAQDQVTNSVLYLPLVIESDSSANASTTEIPSEDTPDTWVSYTASDLHISLAYPPNWRLEVPEAVSRIVPTDLPPGVPVPNIQLSGRQLHLSLVAPDDHPLAGNKIDILADSYEIEPGMDLAVWGEMRTQVDARPVAALVPVTEHAVELQPHQAGEQILHAHFEMYQDEIQPQVIWFTQGRIVYVLNAYTHDDEMTAMLRNIASTITVVSSAPTRLKELRGSDKEPTSLQEQLDTIYQHDRLPEPPGSCSVACRDAKSAPSAYADKERNEIVAASTNVTGWPHHALPSDWWNPVFAPLTSPYKFDVNCGSPYHNHLVGEEFTLDIAAWQYTSVLAGYNATVLASGWDNTGFGWNVKLTSTVSNIADETRYYIHHYAHLNEDPGHSVNDYINRAGWVGRVGGSGGPNNQGVDVHLHFTVRYPGYWDSNLNQYVAHGVDATPLLGFTPDLDYPSNFATCGVIESWASAPVIIESVAFSQRNQPRMGHNWFCYANTGHTNECYMRSMPNSGAGYNVPSNPTYPLNSPEVIYSPYFSTTGQFRVWVCGYYSSNADDSLHVGIDNTVSNTSKDAITTNSSSWAWVSKQYPSLNNVTVSVNSVGNHNVNIWMREDGTRYDRFLLVKNQSYNPNGKIVCGGY